MQKDMLQETTSFLARNRRRRTWKKVVSVLACVVVFCTTYALILPAITLEKTPQCGKKEHTHTEACYTQVTAESKTVPVCTLESLDLHEHAEACLDEKGGYSCGYSDFVIHEHDASCFDGDGNLWCPLPEVEAHTHSESCYAQNKVLSCELSTEPVDASAERSLTCSKAEIILHAHNPNCFDENDHLICGKTQVLKHIHSASCFQTVENPADGETLICQLEEHSHSQDCFQSQTGEQPAADSADVPEESEQPAADSADGTEESEQPAADSASASEESIQPAADSTNGTAEGQQMSIQLDTPLDVDVPAGQIVKIPFVPEVTHQYIFTSREPDHKDTYGYLYAENGRELQRDDNSGGNRQFKISCTLTAGTSYYLGVKYYSSSAFGSIPVLLSYGEHKYQTVGDGIYSCTCGSTFETGSGSCGKAVVWSFEDGVLSISGSGAMYVYGSSDRAPWYQFRNLIEQVIVEEGVTSIGSEAFSGCTSLADIVIPEGVTSIGSAAFSGCTGLAAVTLPSTLTIIGYKAFSGCTSLTDIVIPEGVTSIGIEAFSGCTSLETITVSGTVSYIGGDAFRGCNSLKTLYWNAANAQVNESATNNVSFRLVLGPNSKLTQTQFGPLNKMGCVGIELPRGHYLTLSGFQADFLDVPMTILPESLYYVDEQGVLYRVDEREGKAFLVCCPVGVENYTVLAQLPEVDSHVSVPVVGADTYALAQASDLKALRFDAPENITELKDFAFSNAKNLASINGKTTEEEVLALFSNAKKGVGLIENTKIGHAAAAGDAALSLEAEGMKVSISTAKGASHDPAIDEYGVLRFYTGETATTVISVSNPQDQTEASDAVLRVYYRMDTEEGELNYKPGTYFIETDKKSTITMTVFETSVPGCYCLELNRPGDGETVSLTLEGKYPSPGSSGGTATVWGAILTKDEIAALGDGLVPMERNHAISWETVRDTFPVTKDMINAGSAKLGGNGKGGAYVTGLSYLIKMQREGGTLEGMGKDHMTSADFVDVLTLSEGMQLSEAVQKAIRDRTYTIENKYIYDYGDYFDCFYLPDGTQILMFRTDSKDQNRDSVDNLFLDIDEKGRPEIHWTFHNMYAKQKEIETVRCRLVLSSACLEIPTVENGRTYTVQNDVTVTQHFMHSEDEKKTDGCSITFTPEAGTLELYKQFSKDNVVRGEAVPMQITLKNPKPGISPPAHTIWDEMPDELYMTAEQMAEALCADHQLKIQISGATLCAPLSGQTVTGMDGTTTAQLTQQDTGAGTRYNGISHSDPAWKRSDAKITLVWGEDGQLSLALDEGTPVPCEATGAAIQQVLDKWGYLVTESAQYTLTWDLRKNGNPVTLVGGASIRKEINVTMKDTFMRLNADQKYALENSAGKYVYNYAWFKYGSNAELQSVSPRAFIWRSYDFWLTKGWSMNGQEIKEDTVMEQGMVLDYQLTAHHIGTAHYDVLPLTDHLTGSQALLVPMSLNQSEAWAADCPTVTLKDGSLYYILKNEGTYGRVWTSPEQMADTVTVTKTDSGLDTVIKWYFTDYGGTRTDTVKYHAQICPQDAMPEGAKTFSLGNETWLGDHESHRLYNTIPGWWGTTLRLDKKIVEQVGDDGGWDYSQVKEGSAVTYRLTVYGLADEDGSYPKMTFTSADLYDALPKSVDDWRWDKDKIQIAYQNAEVTGGEDWSVTGAKSNQQEIRWGESFQMTFTERADIYVTLQFPKDDPWVRYANTYAITGLVNTFHALGGQVSVTHDLSIQGRVRLQKGVYSSGYDASMGGQTDARWYYSHAGDGKYYVKYYVTLYNGGRTNLYLTDMQDRLPRGFTYAGLGDTWDQVSAMDNETAVVYKDAEGRYQARRVVTFFNVSIMKAEDGVQYTRIHFVPPSDSYTDRISYDEEKGMCYLKPGEYIAFAYTASTNQEPDTDPEATNIIAMPYYDFNGGGVALSSSSTIVANAGKYKPNDGICEIDNAGGVHSMGFTGGETDTQWLTSQVTVRRGDIRPGITKKLASATDINGHVTQDPVSVNSADTLKWKVIADNDGTLGLKDYVLTDSMQAPYRFTGVVRYTAYNGYWSADSQSSTPVSRFNADLFTIQSWDEDSVTILHQNRMETTLKFGQRSEPLSYDANGDKLTYTYFVTFYVDPDTGNAVMSLRFQSDGWTIWPGCSAVLTLETKNPENTLANKQFINTAFITPLAQTWDHTVNKGNYTSYQTSYGDAASTVRNSAPVSTAFGYATSAVKRVEEAADSANSAASNNNRSYIALSDTGNEFIYTLTVNNVNEKAMDRLLFIDRLPEVGDHAAFDKNSPRESEFKVSFADEPNFEVIVTKKDGTENKLTPGTDYTLQFSDKTEFEEADWNGDDTGWGSELGSCRTVRLKIDNPAGTLIPAKSSVSLRFTCKVDDPAAQPGQIAWNAFGYRYSMVDVAATLDAAPLKVGVKIPTVPKLVKKLVDHRGAALTAEEDGTFSFLVHTGEALTGSWETAQELKAALVAEGRIYREFSVSVPAGKSESEMVMLPENSADGWEWNRGKPYTVVELPAQGSEYSFRSFGVMMKNACTFAYDPAENRIITCSNTRQLWNVDLTKAEPALNGASNDKPLAGAVFALYSPATDDKIEVPSEYAGMEIARTLEQDGTTWYLHSVETTGLDGKLGWTELNQARYCLLEVKAPDGYKLPKENLRLLSRSEESQGSLVLTVYNYPGGYELPESGGIGTNPYTIGGLLLIAASLFLLYSNKKRRKEEIASS